MTEPILGLPYPFNGTTDLPSPISLITSVAGYKRITVIPSICTPSTSSDLDNGFISSVLLSAGLPDGATIESELSPTPRTVIRFKGETYTVSVRKDGAGACFDFTPPIPISK